MDFKDIWKRRFWFGLELVLDLDGVVGDGGRQLGEEGKFRKAYYPVWQALGRSSFVDVRPSRWHYAVHWLRLNNVVSLVLGQ